MGPAKIRGKDVCGGGVEGLRELQATVIRIWGWTVRPNVTGSVTLKDARNILAIVWK